MSGLGAAVSGALGALGGLANTGLSYKQTKKLMKYQNELDVQNWNMVNAYNAPSAQMARYKDAGLNPNLIYGQSNTAGSIAQPGAKMDVDVAGPAMQAMDLYQRMDQMKADTSNKRKQNSLLDSQKDYIDEQVKGLALENALKRRTLDSIGPGVNPNDPYWYRDIKNLGRYLMDKTMSAGPQVEVRELSTGPTALDLISPRRLLDNQIKFYDGKRLPPKGKLIIQGDRRK